MRLGEPGYEARESLGTKLVDIRLGEPGYKARYEARRAWV